VLIPTLQGDEARLHWIVPLCYRCNALGSPFALKAGVVPVWANARAMGCELQQARYW
jgi:hypothetical protein